MDQHRPGKLRGRCRWSLRLQYDPLIGGFDKTASANSGGLSRRRNHVLHADAVLHESLRIELELKLAHVAAEELDSGHSGHGQDVRLDRPVRNRP